jgi:hypothetical protein
LPDLGNDNELEERKALVTASLTTDLFTVVSLFAVFKTIFPINQIYTLQTNILIKEYPKFTI